MLKILKSAAKINPIVIIFILTALAQIVSFIVVKFGEPMVNSGVFFGFFKEYLKVIIILSVIAIAVLSFLTAKAKGISRVCLALIISGLLSNLIDRLIFGGAVDYLNIKIIPVFNLADVYICLGVLLFASVVIKND